MVKRRLIGLCIGVARDVHDQLSRPVSIRYSPLGSTIATSLTMQPSPRVQRHGNAANVTRLPVTLSMSPPTFSKPQMPADRIALWQGSHSRKSFATLPPVALFD